MAPTRYAKYGRFLCKSAYSSYPPLRSLGKETADNSAPYRGSSQATHLDWPARGLTYGASRRPSLMDAESLGVGGCRLVFRRWAS